MESLRGTLLGIAAATVLACAVLPAGASASVIVYRCGSPAELCQINPDGTGQQQLNLGPGAKFDGKLSKARRFTLHVVVVVQDAAGDRATRSYTVAVSR